MAVNDPNLRHMTHEQFSDGTAIDGLRQDKALDEMVDHFNSIPLGDIRRRFVPIQFVFGWSPIGGDTGDANQFNLSDHHWPWMHHFNTDNQVIGTTTVPDAFQNPHRCKGVRAADVDESVVPDHSQWVWTNSFFFYRPAIITSIVFEMGTYGAVGSEHYSNTFQGGVGPPDYPGHEDNEYSKDFCMQLSVDSPFNPENRMHNDLEWNRWQWNLDSAFWTQLGRPGALLVDDMAPAEPYMGDGMEGVMVIRDDLNIPIHERARCRLSILIPMYDESAYDTPWGEAPPAGGFNDETWRAVNNQTYHLTVCALQELTSGRGR